MFRRLSDFWPLRSITFRVPIVQAFEKSAALHNSERACGHFNGPGHVGGRPIGPLAHRARIFLFLPCYIGYRWPVGLDLLRAKNR